MVGAEDSTEGELLPPPPLLSKAWLTRLHVHLATSGRTPLRPLCPLPPQQRVLEQAPSPL